MRVSIFPLPGAILFPGLQLPLHIFEPRYRALVKDALARDRRIGMIQPQRAEEGAPLFRIGCLGKIGEVEALDDGRFNLVLEGEARFRIVRELDAATPFRQVEAELLDEEDYPALSPVERASFEREARRFADAQGYSVDWEAVTRLDDQSLIDGTSQIVPFDIASKQA
ncbi:MAG TPA: LON peptidase substrate-binding domain-containing protein, partial [Novosphingobium sp.]|nr:LON peptidase substrate-binding domain-containing protein [Novosphingobium sp.]